MRSEPAMVRIRTSVLGGCQAQAPIVEVWVGAPQPHLRSSVLLAFGFSKKLVVLRVVIVGFHPGIVASLTPTPRVEILPGHLLERDPIVQQLFLVGQVLQKNRPEVRLLNVGYVVARFLSNRLYLLLIPDEIVGKVVRCVPDISDAGPGQSTPCSLVPRIDLKRSAIEQGLSQVLSAQSMCIIIFRFSP